jgi:V8-like Glu-specific endopeptidase
MLIVFQVPLADLRAFRVDGARRSRPHWPTPDSGVEFVRYFGPVCKRGKGKGKPLAWADELFFVDAARALHLTPFTGQRKEWKCAFRRLLSDGGAVVRFEVGFHIPPAALPQGTPMLDTLATMLETPCTLRGERDPGKLLLIGKRLARLYARATAPRGTRLRGDEVIAGQPTVLVQFGEGEGGGMPKSLDFDSDHLAFMNSSHSGTTMNVWFTNEGFGDPRDTRTALLRLSAEHQCLKHVLRDIADGNVNLDEVTPRTDRLQQYLDSADRTLSKSTRFGVNQADLIRLAQTFETLCGGPELAMLRQQLAKIRPQIRTKIIQLADDANRQQPQVQRIGPDFQWRGDFEETEYQAFFTKPRPPLDVAWLTDVANRLCPAVCLIEIPKIGRRATGFLVAKDLVLTNWHVVEKFSGDDKNANLAGMQLSFTRSTKPERLFKLAVEPIASPLVAGSPMEQKDYALLRVGEDVAAALALTPFNCAANAQPVQGQGIHIIQHPGGGPLKISVDEDGVAGVYPTAGKVQYISNAQDGSSGSPCIDGDKHLVALHHAEVQKSFGSAREGVLMSAIYADISPFLHE